MSSIWSSESASSMQACRIAIMVSIPIVHGSGTSGSFRYSPSYSQQNPSARETTFPAQLETG